MSTSTKRPSTITQTSGSYASGKYYRTWSNLANLRNEASFADCGVSGKLIGGKNGTYPRPAPLKLSNFGFNIPSTSKISKITVYYRHYKPKIGGAYPTFNAPTIDLLNVSADAKKGSAVPTSSTEYSVSWTISPSVSQVNSSSFGVSINYPANTSTNPGQLRLRNVRIVVTYTTAVSSTSSSTSTSSSSSSSSSSGGVSGTSSNVTKSKAYPSESVDITLTISASANITASTKMYLSIPDGVEFLGKKNGNGSITNERNTSLNYQGNENYCWLANFSNSNSTSITFTIRPNNLGTKNFTFREESTGKTTSTKIICESPPTPIRLGDFESIITTDEELEFIILCNMEEFINYFQSIQSSIPVIEKSITVTFPNNVLVNWEDEDLTVVQNGNEYTVTKTLDDAENTFKCLLSFPDIGKYSIILTDDNGNTIIQEIKVKPSNLTFPYYAMIEADEYIRDRLGNSKEYTLSSLMQISIDSEDSEYEDLIEPYEYNYRLGVFNTTLPEDYAEGYLLENAEWSNPINVANTWEEIEVNFFYSEEHPLIFLITGEYIESIAEKVKMEYTYPCLIEKDYMGLAEPPGIFEYPIKEIPTDEGVVSIDLQSGQVTNIVKAYDVDFTNFLESDEDNKIIQGVTVLFDVISCDNPVSIMCKLVSPSFTKEGNRSVNIESVFLEDEGLEKPVFSGTIELGGSFDLWGLDFDDFKLSKLEDLEIDLQFLNNFEQACHIEFNNLYIVFHYMELEEAKVISHVNGVDLRYFNVFIQDVLIKPGTNNDVKYLDVEGTDSNLAYRSNIREKEIEMEIRISGCDVEETTAFVERLARILSNKRDKFNKPVLNKIEFSHHPNKVFEYILEDALDVSVEFTEYEGKIKLIVPSGTAYSKEPIITNATGTNSGIAKVNPIIRVINQIDFNNNENSAVIVKETVSGQEWRLNDSTLEVGDLLRIDCNERKVYKVTNRDDEYYLEDSDDTPDIDITSNVDFNSDWFIIQDDYNFECENTAIIQSVSFYERW